MAIHKGGMHPAQNAQGIWRRALGNFQHLFRHIDRGCDRGGAHHIGLQIGQLLVQAVIADVVCHRIDEMHIVKARAFQRACQIGHPGRGPVAGNFRTARVVIRVYKDDSHVQLPYV